MRIWWIGLTVVSSLACSSTPEREARKRVADKEVNTKHLKGTTEVLKNYRYGKQPDGGRSDSAQQTRKEKAK